MVLPDGRCSANECRCAAFAAWVLILTISPLSAVGFAETGEADASGADRPLPLDLSRHFGSTIRSVGEIAALAGERKFDALPFRMDGVIRLYGRTEETNARIVYPDSALGIEVGRKFGELQLVHYAMWPEVEGEAIAKVRVNYADGTQHSFPIQYGVHVLDWYDLPSYAAESVSDPLTTICWRRPPHQYNAPVRLFKSTFKNPFPDKIVESLDFLSTRSLSVYCLLAATVSDSDTVAQLELPAKKRFDGKLDIRVVDDENDEPIEGALVLPGLQVENLNLVGSPFRTTMAGEGTILFPTKTTKRLSVQVKKEGYEDAYQSWEAPAVKEFTFRLRRGAAE